MVGEVAMATTVTSIACPLALAPTVALRASIPLMVVRVVARPETAAPFDRAAKALVTTVSRLPS